MKNVVITGGTSGIGLATAKAMLADSRVIVIGHNPRKNATIAQQFPEFEVLGADMSKVAEINHVFAEINRRFGDIDQLFVNVGLGVFKPFEEFTEADFDSQVALNNKGAFFTIQTALKYMPDGGNIVVNESWTYHRGLATSSLYSSTKAGVAYLVKALALELAQRQIRINAVSPGYTNTEQFNQNGIEANRLGRMLEQVPAGRFGDSSEIASTVKFLMSEDASYINGQEIVVDGGMTSVQAGV